MAGGEGKLVVEDLYPHVRRFINHFFNFLKRHPRLDSFFARFVEWHERAQGYRALGLRRDDIISEEFPIVRAAIQRLTEKEAFDRAFRLRRAIQLHISGDRLPLEEQISREDVSPVNLQTLMNVHPIV